MVNKFTYIPSADTGWTKNTTISGSLPANLTPLSPNGFKFTIASLPEVEYHSQTVDLPGITFGDPILANPFAGMPVPGDH